MDLERYARDIESCPAVSNEWGEIARQILQGHAGKISAGLRQAVQSKGLVKTGKLSKEFRPSIAERYGDPYALRFAIPRYGYILNAGRRPMPVEDKDNNRRYQWNKAIPKHEFIEQVLTPEIERMADELQKAGADVVVESLYKMANQ